MLASNQRNRPAFVFVESNTSGTGRLFVRAAQRMGFHPILFASEPARWRSLADEGAEVHQVDTRDDQALVEACADLAPGTRLAGVTSSSEYFVRAAAALAQHLGLPGPSAAAIGVCRDKEAQRNRLKAAGVPTPRFIAAHSVNDVLAACESIGFPVVLKPVNGSGSVGVRICGSAAEAVCHLTVIGHGARQNRGSRRFTVLVEEFIAGPEYSVEVFHGAVVGVTAKHVSAPPYAVETGHDYPANLPPDERAVIGDAAIQAITELGLTWGPAHVELRVSSDGPRLIEVNPRLAGGFIPELVRLATGIDLIAAVIAAASGSDACRAATTEQFASIRFLIPEHEGTLVGVERGGRVERSPEIAEVAEYLEAGATVQLRGDFRDRIGHVIAVAAHSRAAVTAVEQEHGYLRVRTRPLSSAATVRSTEDTGRISAPVTSTARRILFTVRPEENPTEQLWLITEVDRAHLVMLFEQGLLTAGAAGAMISLIDELRRRQFEPLLGRDAPRGLYLLYENYLSEILGKKIGGSLPLGRSRNDLQATTLRLRLRQPYHGLIAGLLRLQAVLLQQARRFSDVVMPAYTHLQPALPITYAHYLCGIALAVRRDVDALFELSEELQHCPLGAGAVGGTSLPIDTDRTAALLGFNRPVLHSIDAVASRDLVLRLLAAATIAGVTLSRLATDLLYWSTSEMGMFHLPDSVVGSSSMMPQKRNAFLLEHVQGRSASAVGSFVSAATAMHAKPFTNHIAVGTEGTAPVWSGLRHVTEAAALVRLVVSVARPERETMLRRATDGYTTATELANRITLTTGVGFRDAHKLVGQTVRDAVAHAGEALPSAAARMLAERGIMCSLDGLDPESVVEASEYGGGPGARSFRACWDETHSRWRDARGRCREMTGQWAAAAAKLNEAVTALSTTSASH